MKSRWVSFFYKYQDLPKEKKAFSTWVGPALLIANTVVQFSDIDKGFLELTRPLCEVVCVAGNAMTIMLPVRCYYDTNFAWWMGSLVAHILVGLSAWGAPVTAAGLLVCTVALLVALVVYWVTHAGFGWDTWPYQLAPFELMGLCLSMIVMRCI